MIILSLLLIEYRLASMKDMFPEYYRPSDEDFEKLWEEATFVFDANVLLDIYRYSPQTSSELIEIMQSLQDRLWLPYQFALEYHKHLDEISSFPPASYDDAIKHFDKLNSQILHELNNLKNRTRIETEQWIMSIEKSFENIKSEIIEQKSEHEQYLGNDIPTQLHEIFTCKIGNSYSQDELAKIYREGKERYKQNIPPGYKDENKGEPDCYNDLVGWKQIIDFAKQENKSIIFVTRDTKEDWFREVNGNKSPRPELIMEMREEANVSFYIYKTFQFMRFAKNYLNTKISNEALTEIETFDNSIKESVKELDLYSEPELNRQRVLRNMRALGIEPDIGKVFRDMRALGIEPDMGQLLRSMREYELEPDRQRVLRDMRALGIEPDMGQLLRNIHAQETRHNLLNGNSIPYNDESESDDDDL